MTSEPGAYPLRLTGRYEASPSRWLWLVKIVLLFPHWIALIGLWIAVAVVWVIALFAILFTGRYPQALFEFVVGVLRWTWRVGFYSVALASTDRYPPFSLGPDPDYPATLEADYPERLSRGLVLVKWWLLALPQLLLVGLIGGWSGWEIELGPGLANVLLVIAAVALLVTGHYPRGLFDLLMGLNRWTFRVTAYVLLLTDRYPPFRLDQGENEPTAATQATAN